MVPILFILTVVILFLAGCGETNEACQFAVTRALDKGNYDEVIKRLEKRSCGYSDKERYINLGAAYAGKAGLDPLDIAREMINSARTGKDAEKVVMNLLANKASGSGLFYMRKSASSYKKAINNNFSVCQPTLDDELTRDACFYGSVISFAVVGTSFNLLIENVGLWVDPSKLDCNTDVNRNNNLDTGDASGCAIKYAVNGTVNCQNGVAIDQGRINPNLTVRGFNFEYVPVIINANASKCPSYPDKTIHKLLYIKSDGTKSLVVTDGYCSPSDINNKCTESEVDGQTCIPCPVFTEDQNGNITPATVENTIANTINDAVDMAVDQETKDAINNFINTNCGPDGCSEAEIGNYLYGG